eukprot:sb/3473180/
MLRPVEHMVIVLFAVTTGQGLLCDVEIELDNVTSYEFAIPHDPSDVLPGGRGYWRSSHLNYVTFGAFSEDFKTGDGTTITGKSILNVYKVNGQQHVKLYSNCRYSAFLQEPVVTVGAEHSEISLPHRKESEERTGLHSGIPEWDTGNTMQSRGHI